MFSCACFVIDLLYNNKVYEQSHAKCAYIQQAFVDFLSCKAWAGPAVKPLIVSCCQHSPFKDVILFS